MSGSAIGQDTTRIQVVIGVSSPSPSHILQQVKSPRPVTGTCVGVLDFHAWAAKWSAVCNAPWRIAGLSPTCTADNSGCLCDAGLRVYCLGGRGSPITLCWILARFLHVAGSLMTLLQPSVLCPPPFCNLRYSQGRQCARWQLSKQVGLRNPRTILRHSCNCHIGRPRDNKPNQVNHRRKARNGPCKQQPPDRSAHQKSPSTKLACMHVSIRPSATLAENSGSASITSGQS